MCVVPASSVIHNLVDKDARLRDYDPDRVRISVRRLILQLLQFVPGFKVSRIANSLITVGHQRFCDRFDELSGL